MKKFNVVVSSVIATVLSLALATGCSHKNSTSDKVTIAYNPSGYDSAVSHLMIAENLLLAARSYTKAF